MDGFWLSILAAATTLTATPAPVQGPAPRAAPAPFPTAPRPRTPVPAGPCFRESDDGPCATVCLRPVAAGCGGEPELRIVPLRP